ncbi:unnamed protein product [Orchesella dallaii]|uniref:Uncharacterized protein n=1 Tax=Orchesella dallaii TaxID=48710 RepID=A0ABP1PU23_9HEXA
MQEYFFDRYFFVSTVASVWNKRNGSREKCMHGIMNCNARTICAKDSNHILGVVEELYNFDVIVGALNNFWPLEADYLYLPPKPTTLLSSTAIFVSKAHANICLS